MYFSYNAIPCIHKCIFLFNSKYHSLLSFVINKEIYLLNNGSGTENALHHTMWKNDQVYLEPQIEREREREREREIRVLALDRANLGLVYTKIMSR